MTYRFLQWKLERVRDFLEREKEIPERKRILRFVKSNLRSVTRGIQGIEQSEKSGLFPPGDYSLNRLRQHKSHLNETAFAFGVLSLMGFGLGGLFAAMGFGFLPMSSTTGPLDPTVFETTKLLGIGGIALSFISTGSALLNLHDARKIGKCMKRWVPVLQESSRETRETVRDLLAAWRGKRRYLLFCFDSHSNSRGPFARKP